MIERFLDEAKARRQLVAVHRDALRDSTTGIPIAIGSRWCAFAKVGKLSEYDGIDIIRSEDITRIVSGGRELEVVERLAKDGMPKEWPRLDVESSRQAIETVSSAAGHVTVHIEHVDPDVCFIGEVQEIDDEACKLLAFSTIDEMGRKDIIVVLDQITRIQAFGTYESMLMRAFRVRPK